MNQLAVTEADLHAYVDGFLSEARRQEVDAYLAARPEELERINTYREQNEALRLLFKPVLDEPVPARLTSGLTSWTTQFGRYAAMLAIAVAGGIGGWMLHGATQTNNMLAQATDSRLPVPLKVSTLARQAAVAHSVYSPDARRPVEVTADQEDQLVAWLSKRTGSPMRPPKLGKLGYELIGGRLLPGESGPVAQFMYQDGVGQRLTLYVSTDQAQNTDTGFRFAQEGAVNVFYWIDGKFGYALSASINKGELANIAHAVYEQLDKAQ
ncbi:anti-sigma factor family protein [Herminiimonas arsenitoxidans]|uniref:anti-sigma factor family protein n=1 Tax=Herminiimonas arsenitoxidans TaxID=1809410 RepID=UPI0009713751|nr:anti-sigma factor [Herminiimonas arsenitoxidans]